MRVELKTALADRLLAMGDDELILGHRNSEWCGHAPILEEDIAFANIALDEIGHAIIWYGILSDLLGENRESHPDKLVYWRSSQDYRNTQFVELPKGDWAFTMIRQYLFDVAENIWLEHLAQSKYQPIADAAAKIRKEEIYHLRHTRAWVRRLGLGTEASNRRMQNALNQLWPYTTQLFMPLAGDSLLVAEGYIPSPEVVRDKWLNTVSSYLTESELSAVPEDASFPIPGRDDHTDHLTELLNSLQEVVRQHPNASW